jgi:thiol-disulfide isomerase/thioredoxin
MLLAFAAVVMVVAATAAVVLGGALSGQTGTGSSATATVTTPTVSGGALAPFTDASADTALGRPIPQAAGTSFEGTPVSISANGQPKILLFLAHWCPHCQAEVPVVQRWLDAGRLPAGIELISIATAIDPNRPNYPPHAWLQREGWTAPVLVDPEDTVATRYGLGAFPYWVSVGADGTVAQRLTGELTDAQLDALAASLVP